MSDKHALQVGLNAACLVFAVTHVLPDVLGLQVLWYYPLEHRWAFELEPSGLAMGWFGRSLFSSVAALAVFYITYAIARRGKGAMGRGLQVWAGSAALAVTLAMALYTWHFVEKQPNPETLPDWYAAK